MHNVNQRLQHILGALSTFFVPTQPSSNFPSLPNLAPLILAIYINEFILHRMNIHCD